MVREERSHFLFALEIFLLRVMEPVGFEYLLARVQADEVVVHRAVLLVDEVHVVGGNHLDTHLSGEPEYFLVAPLLCLIDILRQSGDLGLVEHHFEVIILPEEVLVPFDRLPGSPQVTGQDILRNLSRKAGGTAYQAFVVLFQYLVADPRLVVEALDEACRNDLHQVPVAIEVLGQQDKVVVLVVLRVLDLVVVMAGDIHFAADDRLHGTVLSGILEKLLHAVHIAVVGDGQGRHTHFLSPVEQGFDRRKAVKYGILCMDVQMYESHDRRLFFSTNIPKKAVLSKGKLSTNSIFYVYS